MEKLLWDLTFVVFLEMTLRLSNPFRWSVVGPCRFYTYLFRTRNVQRTKKNKQNTAGNPLTALAPPPKRGDAAGQLLQKLRICSTADNVFIQLSYLAPYRLSFESVFENSFKMYYQLIPKQKTNFHYLLQILNQELSRHDRCTVI